MLHALLLLAGASGVIAQPSSVISSYGLGVSVLCHSGPPLERCRVEGASPNVVGSRRKWSLKEVVTPGGNVEAGRDQCGFSLHNKAAREDLGFRCSLRLQQHNGSEVFDLYKIIAQKSSKASAVYFSSTGQLSIHGISDRFPNDEFAFLRNDTVTATCAFPEPRLPNEMSWYLDNPNLSSSHINREIKNITRRDLHVNEKITSNVKCKRRLKMLTCDVIFHRNGPDNVGKVPSMKVECEFGDDVVLLQPAIEVSPPVTMARDGDRVTVLCHADNALQSCRIEKLAPNIGHSPQVWHLNENLPASQDGVAYAGHGLSKGDCGFTVQRVTQRFNGQFRCIVGLSNRQDDGIGAFTISVTGKHEAAVLPRPTVNVSPLTVTREGGDVTVLCRFDIALNYCTIEKVAPTIGHSRLVWDLRENLPPSQDGVVYAGRGLDKGECGFTVRRVTQEFNGQFRCVVGFSNGPEEGVAIFNISIVVAPSAPDLKISLYGQQSSDISNEDFQFREGDLLTASCAIRDSRPPATISWYLDGKKLAGSMSSPEIIHQTERDLFTVKQNISFPLSCENSGKVIKCVGEHLGLESTIDTGARINVACDMTMVVMPAVTVAREGDRVTVLCRAEGALQYCRIEKLAPNLGHSHRWWYLNENLPVSQDGVAYAGSGLSAGECGFTVHRVSHTFTGQFRCVGGLRNKSGEGVGAFNISVVDCGHGSVPTKNMCTSFTSAFQCENGISIHRDGLCNGIKQCADGSDETIERCGNNTTSEPESQSTPSVGCMLPLPPENGQYKDELCKPPCQRLPGQIVENAILTYTCDTGFVLSQSSVVYCTGEWSAEFPTCSRTCTALKFPSREIECKLNNNQVDCNQPMAPGTRAVVKCNVFYTNPKELDDFVITCQSDGSWSRQVFPCSPKCGEPQGNGVPFIAGGEEVKNGEFPWHVGIYRFTEERYKLVCGGNLITERTVVTAAHCFWDLSLQEQISSQQYRIAVGKFYREWNHPYDKHVQTSEIDSVILHDRFRGNSRNWADDIAVAKLKNSIVMTVGIAPICVDYTKKLENVIFPGKAGIVTGWGSTENQTLSDTLRKVTLPYVDFHSCEKKVPESFLQILTSDKFCAGYDNGTSVCGGDSGGGFAVPFANKYFLVGLVSIGVPGNNMECNNFQYTTFTKVSEFYGFIQDNIS